MMYRLFVVFAWLGGFAGAKAQPQQLWVLWYDGVGIENFHGISGNDSPVGLSLDSHGNIIVAGTSLGYHYVQGGVRFDQDYTTVKYDPFGNPIWVARHDDPTNWTDILYSFGIDADDNTYLLGNTGLVKQNPAGSQVWIRQTDIAAVAMAVNRAGELYLTGPGGIAKWTAAGETIWTVRTNGGTALVLDSKNNAYITGISTRPNTYANFKTAKMTSGGSIAWAREFVGRLGEDRAGALAVDRQGNCYVTGASPSQREYVFDSQELITDILTVKYDAKEMVSGQTDTMDPAPAFFRMTAGAVSLSMRREMSSSSAIHMGAEAKNFLPRST